MKTISLLKAILKEDMNIFRYSTKKKSGGLLLVVGLFILIGSSIGGYAYEIAVLLKDINLTYIMLSIFLAIVTFLTFIEGIYKSQSILFEVKDNDLLLSLPIKKSTIITARIIKLLLFEYLYNLLFIVPAYVVYIIFEHPSINFYIISLIMMLLIPIIPIIISCFIGYIIKMISSKVKSKKVIQTILTLLIFLALFFISMKSNSFINNIASNANSINDIITKIYYPIGAYINLINKFDVLIFIKLLLVNIIPFIIFILFSQKYYFNIISNLNNIKTVKKKNNKQYKERVNKPLIALTKKELKRYFSSTVYMFNTAFGLLLILAVTIILSIKGVDTINMILKEKELPIINIELVYLYLIIFSLLFTSITSSSISLEGNSINLTKSLPIKYKTIFDSKILCSFIIEFPFMLISILIFSICFKTNIIYTILLIMIAITLIIITGIIGLIINLKYPKLNASNDAEVVKQSMSSFISLMIGFGLIIISCAFLGLLSNVINIYLLIFIYTIILIIITIIIYNYLIKKGPKKYQELNI